MDALCQVVPLNQKKHVILTLFFLSLQNHYAILAALFLLSFFETIYNTLNAQSLLNPLIYFHFFYPAGHIF